MNNQPIGQLKTKVKVYCEVCGCKYTRNLKVNVFENTDESIESAKKELSKRSSAEYICKICKTIGG